MKTKTPLSFCKMATVKPLIIVFTISLFIGCKSYKTTTELQTTFVKEELKDLETIRTFFVKDIMGLKDENFHFEFRNKIQKLEASGFANVKLDKINNLFKSVSESTIDEIWETKSHSNSMRNSISYKYLVPNEQGKYLQFLEKNTKHNSRINEYYDKVLKSGNFSHLSMLGYMNDNNLDFDLTNTNIQIVLAIHYITLCHDNNITSNIKISATN
ncbi:hypothetical protein HNV08_06885 [Winogradskyella eckloniae]|uniref:hypothetical protein n=1 Tax=Winogradskyella eckloniae TaxID=1089306 RepID=UPI0015650C2A|nr:hypothetical protein [Winogradskyella eckloniae]NRD19769.1 hypothetical protein [Winogradskyella eckloniae]